MDCRTFVYKKENVVIHRPCLYKICLVVLWYNLGSIKCHSGTECPGICVSSPKEVGLQYYNV